MGTREDPHTGDMEEVWTTITRKAPAGQELTTD